jgi:hypothetical protein
MNDGLPWMRVLMMLGLLTVMFGFPIVTLTLDARRGRRRGIEEGSDQDA